VLASRSSAQVAGDCHANFYARGACIPHKKRLQDHEHSRRAESALQRTKIFQSWLQWMEIRVTRREGAQRLIDTGQALRSDM
jgi:hypothetical protein